jgi:hypothetical protein
MPPSGYEVFREGDMQQAQDSGRSRVGVGAGQPAPAQDYGSSDEKVEYEHPIGTGDVGQAAAEGSGASDDDATGGETWSRALGGNTSTGMVRILAAVAVFILVCASLFWLVAG